MLVPGLIGMVGILSSQFNHPSDTQVLIEPGLDLIVKDLHLTGPFPLGRALVGWFPQHSCHTVAVASDHFGNLGVAPPFLFEQINR
jgi:hypothetical protein